MARLSLFLPPPAGDYSGAASTLFGLDCLVILVDAGCCTRNYVEYDEPRWARRRKTAFSAQLRTLEATLGDERRIVEQAVAAARELEPSCIAVLGTPVPAITGMDLAGIAAEVQDACAIPAVGIATTGFETYEHGVSAALDAFVARFACSGRPMSEPFRGPGQGPSGQKLLGEKPAVPTAFAGAGRRARVNVLGLSPHDFLSEGDADAVLGWLAGAGLDVVFATGASWTLDDLACAAQADASVVVAWSGLAAARRLAARAGVPYLVGRPWRADDARMLADAVRAVCASGPLDACALAPGARRPPTPPAACLWGLPAPVATGEVADAPVSPAAPPRPAAPGPAAPPLLLVGEQVAMASLRPHLAAALAGAGRARPIVVASLFSCERALADPGDQALRGEGDLVAWARAHPGFAWAGDPLLARVPGFAAAPHAELPHEALSSTLFAERAAVLAGEGALPSVCQELVRALATGA